MMTACNVIVSFHARSRIAELTCWRIIRRNNVTTVQLLSARKKGRSMDPYAEFSADFRRRESLLVSPALA
jgi:hypothetical protein